MPSILFRHIVADLTRILVLTTSVLVAVIAFGAAIRPVMQNLLGAEDLLQFVFQASVPMLQFAMPFAAGFAATLVMHRFSTDNEVIAMSACGMGFRRIFAPVAILGGALCVVMLVLVAFVVPQFWTRMKELATADATQVLVALWARMVSLTSKPMRVPAGRVPSRAAV